MPLNMAGYFQNLRSYLNMREYGIEGLDGELKLVEKIFIGVQTKAKPITVTLRYGGDAFAVKLDRMNKNGNHDPLFHFLDDTAKPWARWCDFVIFNLVRNRVKLYCIEFKWMSLDSASVADQLGSGVAWCRTMCAAIKNYTNTSKRICVAKFVVSKHPDPSQYLDETGRYLRRDPTVRHYGYDEVDGMRLDDLENACEETIG